MTTQTLEREDAIEMELEAPVRAEMELGWRNWEQREAAYIEGREDALFELEDAVDDAIAAVEDKVSDALQTFGTWVSDLHIRMAELESEVLSALKLKPTLPSFEQEDEADYDLSELVALEDEVDVASKVQEHLRVAADAVSLALFEFGEVGSAAWSAKRGQAEDDTEFGYWSLMKATADVTEWLYELDVRRTEMLELKDDELKEVPW